MSKPPIGAKKCAHPGCRKTFTAMGRRAYCDEHRPQANGRPAGVAKCYVASNVVLVNDQRAMVTRLVEAAEGLGLARAQAIVDQATAEVTRRALAMRKSLIKSRHEVQRLKARLDDQRIAKGEKLGVEDLDEKEDA